MRRGLFSQAQASLVFLCREKTAKIDIGKFSHLKNLKELRLRAICAGLKLPMFVFSEGMHGMRELTHLRKLASERCVKYVGWCRFKI